MKSPDNNKLNTKLLKDFQKAREAAVPLVVVITQDQAATMRSIAEVYRSESPLIKWDASEGLTAITEKGHEGLEEAFKLLSAKGGTVPQPADPPADHIKIAQHFPRFSIFFVLNGNLFMGNGTHDSACFEQALWNLRDKYKSKEKERTLVVLCPEVQLPPSIKQDFVVLEDPLPEEPELWKIAESIYDAAGVKTPSDEFVKDRVTQMLKGLSAFAAEQSLALSITTKGMDLQKLWRQKKTQIEQTPGLSIYHGHETYADVKGCENIKQFLTRLMKGKRRPTEIVFIDEIEKMFAGISGDNTGASQEQHGEFLRWTQDNQIPALMFVGHPGCSKSFIAKATAGEFEIPEVELNISALKGSLLGQTGEQTRLAFRTILAIGRPLLIATSNSLAILPPELKRRFKYGTWFFDLPTKEERMICWAHYISKYKLGDISKFQITWDEGWTPAEIEVCCDFADNLGCDLKEAASFVVPISKSDPDKVKLLRQTADNRFNSASHEGTYKYQKMEWMEKEISDRAINLAGKVGEA